MREGESFVRRGLERGPVACRLSPVEKQARRRDAGDVRTAGCCCCWVELAPRRLRGRDGRRAVGLSWAPRRMLVRAARSLVCFPRPLQLQLQLSRAARPAMSAPAPAAPPKRPLSTSPPPAAAAPPAAPAAAADHPDSKRVKLAVEDPVSVPPVLVEQPVPPSASATASASEPAPAAAAAVPSKAKQPRKPRQRKGKAPKPGGAEEAGAFDVIALLGQERVDELRRLQEDEARDWVAEAEREWGRGAEGKDLEVEVVGWTDHGAWLRPLSPLLPLRSRRPAHPSFSVSRRRWSRAPHALRPRVRRQAHSPRQHPLCTPRRARPHPRAPPRARLLHVARRPARHPRAEPAPPGRRQRAPREGPRRQDEEQARRRQGKVWQPRPVPVLRRVLRLPGPSPWPSQLCAPSSHAVDHGSAC